MRSGGAARVAYGLAVLVAGGGLAGCNTAAPEVTASLAGRAPPQAASDAERDCLGRAMYFESDRSDPAGLLAVGTVVMNRIRSALFPGSICAVVGQPGQFAPGVLTRPMQARDLDRVADAADAVLAGERHPALGAAMYFHVATRRYHYDNMHYVAVAGGNAFYEKRARDRTGTAAGADAVPTFAAAPAPALPQAPAPAPPPESAPGTTP